MTSSMKMIHSESQKDRTAIYPFGIDVASKPHLVGQNPGAKICQHQNSDVHPPYGIK